MELDADGRFSVTAGETLAFIDITEAERKASKDLGSIFISSIQARRKELAKAPENEVVQRLGQAASEGFVLILQRATSAEFPLDEATLHNAQSMLTAAEVLIKRKPRDS
jgi:hypothetical protein